MTFQDKTVVPGRQAASILELDLDGCARDYGTSPCTADLALTNLVIQSENFGTSWPATEATVDLNITGVTPVGTNNADRIVPSVVSSANHRIVQSFATLNEAHTISLHAKAEGYSVLQLKLWNATDGVYADVRFELADGVGAVQVDTSLLGWRMDQSPGFPGWYRCSITGLPPTLGLSNQYFLYVKEAGLDTANTFSGDGSSGILVVGAQGRPGLVPGKYQPTTTADIDGMGSADDLCFNTFGTCQDTPNYLKEVRTLRFVDAEVTRPVELIDAFPSITGVRYGSTRIQPGGRFSVRGTVSVTLQDFSDNDGGVDDYQGERSYDPETRGTFFGKLKERSKYYVGRPMRVMEGYLDAPFDLANFRTREYIIENIAGPTANGRVTITGKDILALARDDRAKAPTASTGTLAATLTAGGTTITVSTGDGGQYPSGSHIRINDEIILVGTRTVDSLTGCTRGQGGTTGVAHAIDDAIQICLTYDDEPVIDVIDDLLTTYANIPASFIPTTDWEAEEAESLSGYDMTTIISAPTGVTKLLQEICAITLIDLWYSDVDQEIKLKLQTPFTEVTETWTDDDNFVMDSVKVKDLNDQRLSRSLIYYGMRNFAEKLTEPENFNFVYFEIEADKEGVNKYDDEKIRTTFSRWFDGSNSVQVALTSQRLLARFGITPIEIAFDIDAKDVETLQTGDVYDAQTRIIQDVDGAPKTTRFQIIETKPKSVGSKYTYKSLAFFQDPTPDTLTINSNEINYDIFVELGGPPGPVDVTLTVNTTFDVDGDAGSPAMTTTGMHPDSTLHLINNGDIRGVGGQGGKGGGVTGFFDFEPGLGCIGSDHATPVGGAGSGGDAIYTTIDITIDNTNGNIWAGAGGGGGGGADITFSDYGGGGGGGGGIGTDTGNPGSGGVADVTGNGPGCGTTNTNGSVGVAGSTSAAGAGGAGGGNGGAGGTGGADWGDDGDAGSTGVSQSGGSGGNGGFAVRLNGNAIVWEGGNTAARVKGDVA